jgi:hypothetical protein
VEAPAADSELGGRNNRRGAAALENGIEKIVAPNEIDAQSELGGTFFLLSPQIDPANNNAPVEADTAI